MSPQVDSALHSSTLLSNNDDPNRSVTAVAAGSGAAARVENLGGEEVLIPVVKFIQSTYKGPSTIFLGMEQIERAGTRKRDPEAVITAAATTT